MGGTVIDDEFLERVALGLMALGSPMNADPKAQWRSLPEPHRGLFRAHARFVLSFADASALQAGRGSDG